MADPNKQEGDLTKAQKLPGLGDLLAGALGLGVFSGLCVLPRPGRLCAAAAHCKQTKNSDGMFLAVSCSHFGWSPCIAFPPNGHISNIRPMWLHLGFFSWHYSVPAGCDQSSSWALCSGLPSLSLEGWGTAQVLRTHTKLQA